MDDKPDFLEMKSDEDDQSASEPDVVEETETELDEPTVAESNGSKPVVTFRGNSYDLTAVVAVTIGGVILLTCATCNLGWYCLPFVPIILGLIALIAAKDSVDPERTKLLSWIGIGSGAAIILLLVIFFVAYLGFIFFAIAMDSGGF